MTKKAMIDYIEASGQVINFSRSHFEHKLKEDVEPIYDFIKTWREEHGLE